MHTCKRCTLCYNKAFVCDFELLREYWNYISRSTNPRKEHIISHSPYSEHFIFQLTLSTSLSEGHRS